MSWELRAGATVREEEFGGAEGSRTPDPHNAIVVSDVVHASTIAIFGTFSRLR